MNALHRSAAMMLLTLAMAACSQPSGSGQSAAPSAPKDDKGSAEAPAPAAGKIYNIAVVPKGTANPYWKTVHAGAAKAEADLGVKIQWIGPENEDDRVQQVQLVNSLVSKGVDAIVLAPLDDTALVDPVKNAVEHKIPVVIIDSGLKTDAQSSFVATDNRQGGREGAKLLGEAMEGKGKAILMRYNAGSDSTNQREEGFLEEMKKSYPNIEIVSDNQYAGVTKETAMNTAVTLLTKFSGDLQGIFCPNESSASGMLSALQNKGLAGKIKFVGFDASENLTNGMKAGAIDGLVAQDPFGMGYLGVKTAIEVLKGQTVPKTQATSLVTITPKTLETPEIQKLIAPELKGM